MCPLTYDTTSHPSPPYVTPQVKDYLADPSKFAAAAPAAAAAGGAAPAAKKEEPKKVGEREHRSDAGSIRAYVSCGETGH
jgi:hypothetical protein